MKLLGAGIVTKAVGPLVTASQSFQGACLVPRVKVGLLLAIIPAIPALLLYTKKDLQSSPWMYRALWVGAFLVNIAAVSVPGRFDSIKKWEGGIPWETSFEAAAWAFSIWAVIFASELVSTLHVGLLGEPMNALRKAVPFWVTGNVFQSLWCVAFRPEFINVLWLPTALLSLACLSFGLAHLELTSSIRYLSSAFNSEAQNHLFLVRFPLALHFAWLAAASLLNFNSWLAMSKASSDTLLSAAFLSAYGAATLGAAFTWKTRDPFVAFTLAWALAALSDRTRQKSTAALVAEGGALNSDRKGLFGRAHGALASTEKVLSYVLLVLGAAVSVPKDMF